MTTNVVALPGSAVPEQGPRPELVAMLRDVLAMAEDGRLQSFVGTGFCADGCRMSVFASVHPSGYELVGSIEFLKSEYMDRVTK